MISQNLIIMMRMMVTLIRISERFVKENNKISYKKLINQFDI